jgi:hypothetical protein
MPVGGPRIVRGQKGGGNEGGNLDRRVVEGRGSIMLRYYEDRGGNGFIGGGWSYDM